MREKNALGKMIVPLYPTFKNVSSMVPLNPTFISHLLFLSPSLFPLPLPLFPGFPPHLFEILRVHQHLLGLLGLQRLLAILFLLLKHVSEIGHFVNEPFDAKQMAIKS